MHRRISAALLAIAVHLVQTSGTRGQTPDRPGSDWPMYRHDLAGTGFSPLSQITVSNVSKLTPAWRYQLQAPGSGPTTGRGGAPPAGSQATPIVVNRVMYLPA